MEHYEVRMTPFAEKAAREIGQYIAGTLQSPQAAARTLAAIRREIRTPDIMPFRFPLVSEEPWHSEGVHKMPVRNFLVYYWVNEDKKTVSITHIIYAGRDQKNQLSKVPTDEV